MEEPSEKKSVAVGEWRYSLFGCFDNCSLCLCAFILPCLVQAEIAEYYGDSKWLICLLGACIGCNLMPTYRAKFRQAHNIPGSIIGDYIYGGFCVLCQLVQLKREIESDPEKQALKMDRQ